ncbi:MAG TPA: YqiA/YcfP family alpha/beta fold hydrolase [Thioalkalivibrio sp.]|nr:YqiA/YcfP family alpha/beta fold hydrolase [Thioalkalivibrio sp.]
MLIFYVHGFGSTSQSRKGQALKLLLPEHRVIGLDYGYAPDEAVRGLIEQAQEAGAGQEPCVFIGSSLGGLYSRYLARHFQARTVLINPVVRAQLLSALIGPVRNYYTGEPYDWSESDVQALMAYDVPLSVSALVLLDEGDEVLDYRRAVEAYEALAEVVVFPGGEHAFAHLKESIPVIRRFCGA